MGHGYVERMEMAKVRVSESEQERESRSYFVDHFNKYVTEEHPKGTASFSLLPFINHASDNETNRMLLFRDGSMNNAMSGQDRPGSCELSTNPTPSKPRISREEGGCGGGAGGGDSSTVGSASDGGQARTTDSRIGDESKSNTQAAPSPSPMGEQGDSNHHALLRDAPPRSQTPNKVSIIPLIFLIFYEVSGGPFGIEDSVQASGPLLSILGFLVFPLIWSIPEALITAEMGTMFPEDGGYVIWVSSALGPYWGFQQGWMKWLSGVIDNALYPVLFLDYLKSGVPALGGGAPRTLAVLGLTAVLTYMNYRGLTIVGWLAVCLGVFSMLPFLVMGLIAIPRLRPARWLAVDLRSVDWNLYLNTLFWNLNYWDSISTLAGEVENPTRTLPKALFYAVILVVVGYLYPLLAGTGAIPLERELWTDGYFSDIAKILGGVWLMVWVQAASALSNMGMFVAEMSSDSYQLLGMAEHGMLPEFFRKRSRHGTPLVGILFSAFGVVILSWMSFQEIIAAENFLYCFGMLLEFVAFIRLRMKHPRAARPYKVPLGTIGSVLMLVPPTILIVVVLALSSVKVMVVSLAAMAVGLVLQPCLKHVEKKRWLRFSMSSNLPEFGAAQNDAADETLVE